MEPTFPALFSTYKAANAEKINAWLKLPEAGKGLLSDHRPRNYHPPPLRSWKKDGAIWFSYMLEPWVMKVPGVILQVFEAVILDAIWVLGEGARDLQFVHVVHESVIGCYRLEFRYSIPKESGP